jgi:hypothetical protein
VGMLWDWERISRYNMDIDLVLPCEEPRSLHGIRLV